MCKGWLSTSNRDSDLLQKHPNNFLLSFLYDTSKLSGFASMLSSRTCLEKKKVKRNTYSSGVFLKEGVFLSNLVAVGLHFHRGLFHRTWADPTHWQAKQLFLENEKSPKESSRSIFSHVKL